LGLAQVGRHDNFFELGGDSILGLQVIAQAKDVGLLLTPRQLFQQQTIEALAAVVIRESVAAPVIHAEQGLVSGPLPMTPAQLWWFEQQLSELHHWNQSLMVTISGQPDRARLARALGLLLERHDALRIRIDLSNGPMARIEAAVPSEELFTCIDLREMSDEASTEAIAGEAERYQQSLHLERGPLFRAILFDLGPERPSRLLLIAHHLVVDGVSWRIVLEDLERAYLAGEEHQTAFPSKTTSIKQWTEAAQALAKSGALSREAAFWNEQDQPGDLSIPLDDPAGARTEASAETCHLSFSREETEALLRQAPAAYKTQVNDLLLTALVQAFHQWTGEDRLLLDLEGHGRESVVPGTDLSRTVGWFTSMFPLLLRRPDGSTADIVKGIKEQVRAIPSGGVGYGLLRYLAHTPQGERLRHQTAPQVCFNYLGQLDRGGPEQGLFGLASEPTGREHGASNRMPYELAINADVTDGRLTMMWTYSGARFMRATVEMLAASYRRCLCELIAHCCAADAGGYTPSDFPDVQIDQDALDNILETMERSHAR
ncbi:condensation domain-containing protein, partial [Nitrospira defluvii]|uniref:condensation domain-containing protein n=1 Tax=Nitrospira defluvii TaxID=330214 RepID=UPI001FE37E1E